MKQSAFEEKHRKDWEKFSDWTETINKPSYENPNVYNSYDYPALYRSLCQHLAISRARHYSLELQKRLEKLVHIGHNQLYKSRAPIINSTLYFFAFSFPHSLKQNSKYFLISILLFILPAIAIAYAIYQSPDAIYTVMNSEQVMTYETMYSGDHETIGRDRESDTDFMMFGYYIYNNISIGFRMLAGGVLMGIGTIIFLVFNGLQISAVASLLTSRGHGENFWSFVAGHSSFELTAIIIFGAAGLRLGHSLISPGRYPRWHALAINAQQVIPLIYGGTAMLLIAAFVEAFWSSSSWPSAQFKMLIGIMFWILLACYFLFLGRNESR